MNNTFIKPESLINLLGPAVIGAPVLGGFLFGFTHADPPGIASGIFIGLIFAILTPMSLGFPPRNEGGVGEPYNAWPHIGIAFIAIVVTHGVLVLLRQQAAKKSSSRDPDIEESRK